MGISANYVYQMRRNFIVGFNLAMNYKTFSYPERIRIISYLLRLDFVFTLGKTLKRRNHE